MLTVRIQLLNQEAQVSQIKYDKRKKTAVKAMIDVKMFSVKGFIPVILIVMLSNPTVTLIGSYLIRYAQAELGFTAAQTGAWSVRRIVPVVLSPLIGF